MNKSDYFIRVSDMHYEGNFRTLLFTLVYVSCIIVASCNNESLKTDSDAHDDSAEKPSIKSRVSNGITSREQINSSESAVKHVYWEGGSTVPVNSEKNNDTTTSRISIKNDSLNGKILEFESHYVFNDSSSTNKKPHKGRKGVLADITEETSMDQTTFNVLKASESRKEGEEPLSNVISHTTFMNTNSTVNSTTETSFNIPVVNNQVVKEEPADHVNKSSFDSTGFAGLKNGTNQSKTPGNKSSLAEGHSSPRPKPGVTILDHDVDHSSYSLTSTETDYVIPIVATIFAAPLLIVLGMLLYKRSKEFWERRHYRRMDFLIDGMYND